MKFGGREAHTNYDDFLAEGPLANGADVDVYELRDGVETDSAGVQLQGSVP